MKWGMLEVEESVGQAGGRVGRWRRWSGSQPSTIKYYDNGRRNMPLCKLLFEREKEKKEKRKFKELYNLGYRAKELWKQHLMQQTRHQPSCCTLH